MVSIYDVHAELYAACEDRESSFCIEHLATAATVLQEAIAKLEAQAKAYDEGKTAELKDCDRAKRILNSSKNLMRLIEGRELMLPKF